MKELRLFVNGEFDVMFTVENFKDTMEYIDHKYLGFDSVEQRKDFLEGIDTLEQLNEEFLYLHNELGGYVLLELREAETKYVITVKGDGMFAYVEEISINSFWKVRAFLTDRKREALNFSLDNVKNAIKLVEQDWEGYEINYMDENTKITVIELSDRQRERLYIYGEQFVRITRNYVPYYINYYKHSGEYTACDWTGKVLENVVVV